MSEPLHDLAHIAHAELLTPFPDDSLRFFTELFGMEIEHQEGQSVFLRGWGEYQPYGLKLTESKLPGIGHTALRAESPAALARRVAAIDAAGLGLGWIHGDHGHGPAYEFSDPDGHRFEVFFEQDRYVPPEHLRPRWRNVPSATLTTAPRSSASTTSTSSPVTWRRTGGSLRTCSASGSTSRS